MFLGMQDFDVFQLWLNFVSILPKSTHHVKTTKPKPNLSLYSPYYADACDELAVGYAYPRRSAKATQPWASAEKFPGGRGNGKPRPRNSPNKPPSTLSVMG